MESDETRNSNLQSLMAVPLQITGNATIMDEGIIDEGIIAIPCGISESATVMEENTKAAPFDLSENATIVEEGLRLCPLCQSEIKLFFINFNEKLLMCENTECEYPFGHEDLQFYKEDNEAQSEDVVSMKSKRTLESPSATCSVVSAAAWMEIDKLNRAYESEDSQFEIKVTDKIKHKRKREQVDDDRENEISKNIEDIKELSKELVNIDDKIKTTRINNAKWIKNLMNIQTISGMSLVKPEELNIWKKQQPALGLAELKIDIDRSNSNSISLVNIQIMNKTDGNEALANN
ncbi:uncharacterized protein LOC113514012 isoform X2 [Galleria mellonella]|uniref:Uncharacterized protein LOC113514012 isoform X2 n=1 Tax=Galleria mellonella TaxID=7137 RepID=A0ABM3MW83_GALME|nr:uncharacterized protein LOC113514012 isoform X2 [Galleria mellonella]